MSKAGFTSERTLTLRLAAINVPEAVYISMQQRMIVEPN